MAAITPGTGGTLKSATVEGTLLEVALLLQGLEEAVTTDPIPENVNVTLDTNDGTATISATIPISVGFDTSGKPVITATPYV